MENQSIELFQCSETTQMMVNDALFEEQYTHELQNKQQILMAELKGKSMTKDQVIVQLARDTLKLVENDNKLYQEFLFEQHQMYLKYSRKVIMQSGVVSQGKRSLCFAASGKSTKRIEKRRKKY